MRVAPRVVLSPEERVHLLRWSRGNPGRDRRVLRSRVVLEAANGQQDVAIGHHLGISRLTAARWRRRFLIARLRGIDRATVRTPRPGGIPTPRIQEILRATVHASHFGPGRVSTRTLARRFGVSHTTVRRLWTEFGVRPAGIEASPWRPDPVLPLEPRERRRGVPPAPDFAVALALGPGSAGGSDAAPGGPRGPFAPSPEGWSPDPRQLLPAAGPTLAPPRSHDQRLREFLRFVGELERATGRNRPVRIVATLPALEPATELRAWQVRRPNVRLERVESVESWRAHVLRDLDRSGRIPPPEGRRRGRGETTRAIGLFLASYSDSSGPFQWVASSREIAGSDAGSRLRYDLSVTGHLGFKRPSTLRTPMQTPASPDLRAREMARVVLRKCLRLRPGEHVTVESWSETLEYANAFVLEALRLGARPLLLYQDEPTYWAAVAESRPSNLARVGEHLRGAIAKSDALVTFFGPSDRERFHALPPATMFRLSEYPRRALRRRREGAHSRGADRVGSRLPRLG